jgi:hypothetical protein
MSTNNPFADQPNSNPYAAPSLPAQKASEFSAHSPELSKVIKDFRAQSLALGVAWIIIGCLNAGVSALILSDQFLPNNALGIVVPMIAALAGTWVIAGIATLAKQLWGIYLGLVISYLGALGSLANLSICGLVILVLIIVQSHRVINFAKEIRAAGLPLNARP